MGTCYRPPFFPEILQFSFVRCERSRRGGYTVGQAPQLVYVADGSQWRPSHVAGKSPSGSRRLAEQARNKERSTVASKGSFSSGPLEEEVSLTSYSSKRKSVPQGSLLPSLTALRGRGGARVFLASCW